jgi:hypothetical protein
MLRSVPLGHGEQRMAANSAIQNRRRAGGKTSFAPKSSRAEAKRADRKPRASKAAEARSKGQLRPFPMEGPVRPIEVHGDPYADPPIVGFVPVTPSTWLGWVAQGRAPKPRKVGSRCSLYDAREIRLFASGQWKPDQPQGKAAA